MKQLILLLIFLALSVHCWASEESEIIQYWLTSISNGVHDLHQPLLPFSSKLRESEYIKTFPQLKTAKKENFLSFLRVSEPVEECWSRVFGNFNAVDRGFFFDSKIISREVISKILARRIPIINTFEYDKTKYSGANPKYICQASAGGSWDYLGLFQFRLVSILIVSSDLRFSAEAEELLNYVKSPIATDVDIWSIRDKEAKACYTSSVLGHLPRLLESYLQYCRRSSGK